MIMCVVIFAKITLITNDFVKIRYKNDYFNTDKSVMLSNS